MINSILLAVALLSGSADTPPRASVPMPSWWSIPTHRWAAADGTAIVLRFVPEAIGPPTLHTIVDAGTSAPELWYLPWIHDHPDPDADPLPTAYVDALTNALVHFGAQVDVVGIEGDLWGWDVRDENVSPYAKEVIGVDAVEDVRMLREAIAQEETLLRPSVTLTRVDRATGVLLTYTTTPVIGVEDPDLLIPTYAEERGQTIDLDRSRDRSRTAIAVLLTELEVRHSRRALLIFGMAHSAEIEDAVRTLGNVTLRVACIPTLCASAASARTRH